MQGVFGGVFGMIIAIAVLAVAIMWVLLPVIILAKMNEAIKLLREARDDQRIATSELARMRRYYEPDPPDTSAARTPQATIRLR